MLNTLVFNRHKFCFSSEFLTTVFKCMAFNDKLDDDDSHYAISFISKSIVKKTWDDLDYHEFILKGLFSVSRLIRSIANVFGNAKATSYAKQLSLLLNEEISLETKDNTSSIYTLDAYAIAKKVFEENSNIEKFQQLLALLHLYECAYEDYEQLVEDSNGFEGLLNLNGIVVKQTPLKGKLMLKPIYNLYDSPLEQYKDFGGFLVPPFVLNAILNTIHGKSEFGISAENCSPAEFSHYVEQISGHRLILPQKPIDVSSASVDTRLFGKWYNVSKSNKPWDEYTVIIEWYQENGSYKRSIIFCSDLKYAVGENWLPRSFSWVTLNNTLITAPNQKEESIQTYHIEDDTLTLESKYGVKKLYKSIEEALNNIKLQD